MQGLNVMSYNYIYNDRCRNEILIGGGGALV